MLPCCCPSFRMQRSSAMIAATIPSIFSGDFALVGLMFPAGSVSTTTFPAIHDNAKGYAQAAKENKLLEYDDHGNIGIPDSHIDPTCISWVEPEDFQKPLLRMKSLVEEQLQKENFWDISKASLLEIGQCIADMMLIKFKAKINHMM